MIILRDGTFRHSECGSVVELLPIIRVSDDVTTSSATLRIKFFAAKVRWPKFRLLLKLELS